MAYCTDSELVEYCGSEIVANTAHLSLCRRAAEDAINAICQRTFDVAAVTSITRRYVPNTWDTVHIHDIVDNTNLVVTDDGTAVALADIQLEPVNNLLYDGTVTPFYTLRRIAGSWTCGGREATVSVTSTRWGWAAVPDRVKEATLVGAKDLAGLRDTRFGVAGFGEFGVVRMRENPQVRMLLRGLGHPRSVLVG
jgi:hypothetical protein